MSLCFIAMPIFFVELIVKASLGSDDIENKAKKHETYLYHRIC